MGTVELPFRLTATGEGTVRDSTPDDLRNEIHRLRDLVNHLARERELATARLTWLIGNLRVLDDGPRWRLHWFGSGSSGPWARSPMPVSVVAAIDELRR